MSITLNTSMNLEFRPESYFDGSASLLANIAGDVRREMVREALENGEGSDVPAALFASELPDGLREYIGSIHPSMMGGEYLPSVLEREVEIARVRLKSITADVISIRARQEGNEYVYRVVDEYGTWETPDCKLEPARSTQPLTLGELLHLINTADSGERCYGEEFGAKGILGPLYFAEWFKEGDLASMCDFVRVGSEFYPELEECCDDCARAWLETFAEHKRRARAREIALKAQEPGVSEAAIANEIAEAELQDWISRQPASKVARACASFAEYINGQDHGIGAIFAPDCRYESQIRKRVLLGRQTVAQYFQKWMEPEIAATFGELANCPELGEPCVLMHVRDSSFGRMGLGEVRSYLKFEIDRDGLIQCIRAVSLTPDPILCTASGIYPGFTELELREQEELIGDTLGADGELDLVLYLRPGLRQHVEAYVETVKRVARDLELPVPRIEELSQVDPKRQWTGAVVHPTLELTSDGQCVRLIERVHSESELCKLLRDVFE